MSKPRVLVLADVRGWAWARKADAYQRYLSNEFDVTVAYYDAVPPLIEFDLLHLMEFPQLGLVIEQCGHLAGGQMIAGPLGTGKVRWPFKVISGCTAHVWPTWGVLKMQTWANLCDAWHANSRLLETELRQFHQGVFYTPNGVDTNFWTPPSARATSPIIFAHVGKPNPRKGSHLIVEAARQAGVELRMIQRTSKNAYSANAMRDFYRATHVQVTASNMDGTPNPMLEAASCGSALLSTPIGNMPELMIKGRGSMGFRLDPHMPFFQAPSNPRGIYGAWPFPDEIVAQLEEKMRYFVAHPDETAIMGAVARETVRSEWDWRDQVEHVRTCWRAVLG